jgi:hypothetical protein
MYGLKIHVKKYTFYNSKTFQIKGWFNFINRDHLKQKLLFHHFPRLVLNVMFLKERRNVRTKTHSSFYLYFKSQIFQQITNNLHYSHQHRLVSSHYRTIISLNLHINFWNIIFKQLDNKIIYQNFNTLKLVIWNSIAKSFNHYLN